VYVHKGFWQPMDTFREWRLLNELWESGSAPWKRWGRPTAAPARQRPAAARAAGQRGRA
jgi:NDP-sugar pyrophosphorylase family protein